jgi:hypothetical protein
VVSGGIECPNHTVGKCPGVNWGTFSTFKYQTVFQEFSACFGCGFPQEVCMTGVSGCAKCRTGTGQKPPPVPPQPQQAPLPPLPLHPEHLDGAAPTPVEPATRLVPFSAGHHVSLAPGPTTPLGHIAVHGGELKFVPCPSWLGNTQAGATMRE